MRIPDPYSYSYLLGLYLGDGNISHPRGTYQLRITLDAIHPEIVVECITAMQLTLPNGRICVRASGLAGQDHPTRHRSGGRSCCRSMAPAGSTTERSC